MTNIITVPDKYKIHLEDSRSKACLMGLSVGKKEFMNHDIMSAYADFISTNFSYGVFLIADFPKRWNITALEGVGKHKSRERALIAGDGLYNFVEKLTSNIPNLKAMRWLSVLSPQYTQNLDVLSRAYQSDTEFRDDCNERIIEFLSAPKNLERVHRQGGISKVLDVSKNYYLEEMALLSSIPFKFRDEYVEIYPQTSVVQEKLQSRAYPFCQDMMLGNNRSFMEVHYGAN